VEHGKEFLMKQIMVAVVVACAAGTIFMGVAQAGEAAPDGSSSVSTKAKKEVAELHGEKAIHSLQVRPGTKPAPVLRIKKPFRPSAPTHPSNNPAPVGPDIGAMPFVQQPRGLHLSVPAASAASSKAAASGIQTMKSN
jgi:hypothetical protein